MPVRSERFGDLAGGGIGVSVREFVVRRPAASYRAGHISARNDSNFALARLRSLVIIGRTDPADFAKCGRANRQTPRKTSMASIGRLMQIIGLVVPPLSIIMQLQGAITLGQMLTILVACVCSFWIGRIVEGYAKT